MQRILIIEDDFSLNRTLAYSLQSSNYLVDSAYTLKEAIEYLKNNTYLLLILDVNLPDGSGFKDLYKLKEYSDASIIYLTANDLEKDIIQGYDLGADDYITKPFSLPILQIEHDTILYYDLQPKMRLSPSSPDLSEISNILFYPHIASIRTYNSNRYDII